MDNKSNFTKALIGNSIENFSTNDIDKKQDEIILQKIKISLDAIDKIKELKKILELKNDSILNSSMALLYNYDNGGKERFKNLEKEFENMKINDIDYMDYEFIIDINNEERLNDLHDLNPEVVGYILSKGIILYHKKIFGSEKNER